MLRSVNMQGMDKAQSIEVDIAGFNHTIRHIRIPKDSIERGKYT